MDAECRCNSSRNIVDQTLHSPKELWWRRGLFTSMRRPAATNRSRESEVHYATSFSLLLYSGAAVHLKSLIGSVIGAGPPRGAFAQITTDLEHRYYLPLPLPYPLSMPHKSIHKVTGMWLA